MAKPTRPKLKEAEEVAGVIAHRAVTYGQLEAAAGVTDRAAFWHGKTEAQARAALRVMILDRVLQGELTDPRRSP